MTRHSKLTVYEMLDTARDALRKIARAKDYVPAGGCGVVCDAGLTKDVAVAALRKLEEETDE